MRIRELHIHDLRQFRGRHAVSFLDASGERARQVSALLSADAGRRATVLEAIEACIAYAVDPRHPRPLVEEVLDDGWLQLSLELCEEDLQHVPPSRPHAHGPGRVLRIELGRRGLAPLRPAHEWNTLLACLTPAGGLGERFTNAGALSSQLYTSVARMHRGAHLHGGLLYFPGLSQLPDGHTSRTWLGDVTQPWIVRAPSGPRAMAEPLSEALDRHGRPGAVIAFEPAEDEGRPNALAALRDAAAAWDAQLILALHPDEAPEWLPAETCVDLDWTMVPLGAELRAQAHSAA
jgi:hypothetical protein